MKLIANETAYARKCLEQNYIDRQKPYKSIRSVVRYLNRICHINNIDDIYCSILTYIDSTGKDVEIDKETVLTMMNESNPYNSIENITISQKELDVIHSFGYPYSYRKILFTMLVHYKVKLLLYPDNDNKRVEINVSEIMKDAHVSMSVDKRIEMLTTFEEDGLGEIPNGGKQAKYFYMDFIDEEQQEVGVVVEDFFDFYLYYEQLEKGGRLINCQECGKLVLVKNIKDTASKYCQKCRKEKDVEKTLRYRGRHTS